MDDLNALNLYTKQMKEQWDALSSIAEVKSILGIIPKYKYISKILESTTFNNPALNCGLYQVDESTLQRFKLIVLTIRKQHLDDVAQWIKSTKKFVTEERHLELCE